MRGLDVGTSTLIAAQEGEDKQVEYKIFRDAFFSIVPSSPMAAKMIEKGLQGKSYFKKDNQFIVVGQDAIEKAVERSLSAARPLVRGILSPKEQESFSVLKHIISQLLGKPAHKGESIAYSVPAQPIDQTEDTFDVGYHTDVLNNFLSSLNFKPRPLNEGEAICYAELMNDDLTGIASSFGAGMINTCVMSSGEPILRFSLTKGGDWIDRMAAIATNLPDSAIQLEKEKQSIDIALTGANFDNLQPTEKAIAIYYYRLITYYWTNLGLYLKIAEKNKTLPKFQKPIPLILAGGTSQIAGFVKLLKSLQPKDFPFEIGEIRHAKEPLLAVARGCLLYAGV